MRMLPVLLGTGLLASRATPPVSSLSDPRADIYEAVFRALISHDASAEMPNKEGIALCLPNRVDPDPAFLRRFSGNSPPVYPCSSTKEVGLARESVLLATGAPAIIFGVSAPDTLSATRATLTGSYYEASESGAVYAFELELHNGKWLVVKQSMRAIAQANYSLKRTAVR